MSFSATSTLQRTVEAAALLQRNSALVRPVKVALGSDPGGFGDAGSLIVTQRPAENGDLDALTLGKGSISLARRLDFRTNLPVAQQLALAKVASTPQFPDEGPEIEAKRPDAAFSGAYRRK
jgi:hypothetical protein